MWNSNHKIVLASASPRRRDILTEAMIQFEIKVSSVDETPIVGESPSEMVSRLSVAKASSVEGSWVLGADTTVVLNGVNLGKPENHEDAYRMLKALQGNWHKVIGGIALVKAKEVIEKVVIESEVKMAELSDDLLERYIRTDEPMDKAGSYAIQGIGSQFIEQIKGSYTNVVGLDISWVVKALIKHQVIS